MCPSFSRRILFATVKALAVTKMDENRKGVLAKQPVGAAEMPVRAINGESRAGTFKNGEENYEEPNVAC